MYNRLRPYLFRLEAERAHALTLNSLRLAGNFRPFYWLLAQIYKAPDKPLKAFGIAFKNPLGLAAGYDKDGHAIRGLSALGFGHIEIGTVTPRPQRGNPSPRVFRLPPDEALINRLGFPSRGSAFVQQRLDPDLRSGIVGISSRRPIGHRAGSLVLGVNLGKNRDTPNEEAILDYLALLGNFARHADYLTINVSSPNTAGLRQLQGRAALEDLLARLHQQRLLEQEKLEQRVPLLVKLAPDLSESELDDAIEAILRAQMDGIIVTNTTLSREGLRSDRQSESGGLSGRPLQIKSEAVLLQTVKRVNGKIPIVSAGGIMNPDDAKKRLAMGATLIQIYTGLIYHGPSLPRDILRQL